MGYKRKIVVQTIRLILVYLNLIAQQQGYAIQGHIEGLADSEKVSMKLFYGNRFEDHTVRDSGYAIKGNFKITGFVPDGPRLYWITFDKHPLKMSTLFINNGDRMRIVGKENIDNINHSFLRHYFSIEGSPSQYAEDCLTQADVIWNQNLLSINSYLKKIKDSTGFDKAMVDAAMTIKNRINQIFYIMLFYNIEPDYMHAIPIIISTDVFGKSHHAAFCFDAYNNLSDLAKSSFYGGLLKEQVKLCVGQDFPCVTLPNQEGESVKLGDVISKGKATVVQFWGSNSLGLDKSQEELLTYYRKYHESGLNIVGISCDTSRKKWRIAAADLPWYNISDLKGKSGVVQTLYQEFGNSSIPNITNVLIDAQGKIAAWDINGLELQWYLWKQFGD